jgi:hypothetical protein
MSDYLPEESSDDEGHHTRAEVSGVERGGVETEDEMDQEAENVI